MMLRFCRSGLADDFGWTSPASSTAEHLEIHGLRIRLMGPSMHPESSSYASTCIAVAANARE